MYTRRLERKYMIDHKAFTDIMSQLPEITKYEEYTVSNVYYDTDSYDLIRRSLEKPFFKEKLRLRSYGRYNLPYMEIKKQFAGIIYKSRDIVPLEEGSSFHGEVQKMFVKYPLSPKLFVAYDRVAVELGKLRLTFDRDIRYRENYLDIHTGDWGTRITPYTKVLMEAKTPTAFPIWFCMLLNEQNILPISYSKYGSCYTRHIQNGEIVIA